MGPVLELRRLGGRHPVAAQRVGLGHRQVNEQRGDSVAQLLARVADVDGHHRAQAVGGRFLTALDHQAAQPPDATARTTSLTVPPSAVLMRLDLVEVGLHDGEATPRPYRDVELLPGAAFTSSLRINSIMPSACPSTCSRRCG